MDIAIKKVGQRDGLERFVLVSTDTRKVITVQDVSEESLRRFFRQRGVGEDFVKQCLARARKRYDDSKRAAVDEHAETMEGDDLLLQLGLEEDANVSK